MDRPTLKLAFAPAAEPQEIAIDWQQGDSAVRRIFFRSDGPALRRAGDALLCLGLPPALEVDAPLAIGAPLGPGMTRQAQRIADRLIDWYPGLAPLRLSAPKQADLDPQGGSGTGLFFSAGVDSSYSLVTASGRLTHLVTLIGADIPVEARDRTERLKRAVRGIAEARGLQSIIVETNIRAASDRLVGWVEYHGAVLAAVAHMLADTLAHVLIASSADEASRLRPWGTHPDLDPMWGTGGLTVEHHALVPRFTKVAGIVDAPDVMRHLRVCDYDDENCGRCPDCVFMLNALSALDAFDRAPTFRMEDAARGRVIVDGRGTRTDLLDMRRGAMAAGRPPGLSDAIDRAIKRYDRALWLDELLGASAMARRLKRWKRRRRYLAASVSVDALPRRG